MTIFHCLRFKTPPTWRARSPYLYPQGTGWPSYTPGTGFTFRRLRLAGLWWWYSNPSPNGDLYFFCSSCPPYNPLVRTTVENTVSNSTSILACVSVTVGTCLPSICLETALHATILFTTRENSAQSEYYALDQQQQEGEKTGHKGSISSRSVFGSTSQSISKCHPTGPYSTSRYHGAPGLIPFREFRRNWYW
jgi:hypothetical protein